MIKNKNDLHDFLKYESKIYHLKWGGKIKKLLGSESAIIWSWQKRLRKTEYYYNTNKKIRYKLSKILLNWKNNKY